MDHARIWLMLGAVVSGLAVAAGAFAAHGLDRSFHEWYAGRTYQKQSASLVSRSIFPSVPLAQKYLADFKTGAEYQMYHGLALLALGLLTQTRRGKLVTAAGICFCSGCIGFSGGLYVYTICDARWAGMFIVPIGGVFFLAGWLALALAVWFNPSQPFVPHQREPVNDL
jgi:uncharacterized membrane protein YgdD (TMEM256/DUF423 family)